MITIAKKESVWLYSKGIMFHPLRCYKHHKLLKLGECVEEQLLVNPHNVRFLYTRQQTRVLSPSKVEGVEYIMRGKVVEVTWIEIIKGVKNSNFPCIVEM